jgi:hypothetical protein
MATSHLPESSYCRELQEVATELIMDVEEPLRLYSKMRASSSMTFHHNAADNTYIHMILFCDPVR